MGYFSNGSEGEGYHEQYCSRCIHDNFEKGIYCPVWNLHLQRNYEECNNVFSMLHVLIPREGGTNARCTMFVDRNAIPSLAIEKIEHDMIESQT